MGCALQILQQPWSQGGLVSGAVVGPSPAGRVDTTDLEEEKPFSFLALREQGFCLIFLVYTQLFSINCRLATRSTQGKICEAVLSPAVEEGFVDISQGCQHLPHTSPYPLAKQ